AMERPEGAGLRNVGEGIYVDPDLTAKDVAEIRRLVAHARKRVAAFYGDSRQRPKIIFCDSDDCYSGFGAIGSGFSDGKNVVISPSGRCEAVIAHELAHVELSGRLGGLEHVIDKVPQWFDEGQAVFISGAEEFNEQNWLAATDNGQQAPSLDELRSVDNWNRVNGRHGEGMQLTYGTAMREMARWFKRAGNKGLVRLLEALRHNERFELAYARLENAAPPAEAASAQSPAPADSPPSAETVAHAEATHPWAGTARPKVDGPMEPKGRATF
ncbi:MAG: hypothetical protein JNJ60_14975, partial [Rhodocyclaceae bacterium]|nr:hypothetical protein [Rhodocyclaceae bacterium]